MTAADMIPQPSARIIDGMVQKLRGDQKTFAEVVDCMMSMVLQGQTASASIWSSTFTEIVRSRMLRERREA